MVAIPTTTLASALAPAAKPEPDPCKGKGKGPKEKDENCGDGGASSGGPGTPPPTPPSPPAGGGGGGGAGSSNTALIVPAFMLDRREVSASQYAACVASGACTAAATTDPRCTTSPPSIDRSAHPINCVTRAQAASYCTWRQKRLVSDSEWTAAASGGKRSYAWGDTPPTSTLANACGQECDASSSLAADGFVATAPTGSFAEGRSPEGVLDLIGNVAEWVEAASATVRGGSFEDASLTSLSASAARAVSADTASPAIGFRCARSVTK